MLEYVKLNFIVKFCSEMVDVIITICVNNGHQKAICTQIGVLASATCAFWCIIECDKISLITLPSLRQEFSDIMCEFFDLAFTLVNFPTLQACTSWYKLVQAPKSFCKFADAPPTSGTGLNAGSPLPAKSCDKKHWIFYRHR